MNVTMTSNDTAPFRRLRRLGRAAAHVAFGLPISIVFFTFVVTAAALTIGLMPAFLLGIPFAWIALMLSRGFARLERSRASTYRAAIVDPVRPLTGKGWWRRLVERLRSRARWREVAYLVVQFPVTVVSFVLVSAAWCGSMAMLLLPALVRTMPGDTAHFWFFDLHADTAGPGIAGLVGLVGLVVVAPLVTIGAAEVQWTLADRLLGPTEGELLAVQVTEARTQRVAAVDSAEAERRRIERDLHDGAQQRLVALAATLGAARERLDADPAATDPAAREMVASAHEEAKAALGEIRDLVRGIHPVILEDRGIDAALSAVVARSPVPVTLDVQLTERPPAAVESAAYFVVSEALTNVARHSGATRAKVSIAMANNRLVVEITDNGHGGADASKGTGLSGLRERVAGMGGTSYVISPEGGPTTIMVELPCAS